jgi:hypothetical protein
MGEAIGGVSASDIAPACGIGMGAGALALLGPRINSINLSDGTLIQNSLVPFVTLYKQLVNRREFLCRNSQNATEITYVTYDLYVLYA